MGIFTERDTNIDTNLPEVSVLHISLEALLNICIRCSTMGLFYEFQLILPYFLPYGSYCPNHNIDLIMLIHF